MKTHCTYKQTHAIELVKTTVRTLTSSYLFKVTDESIYRNKDPQCPNCCQTVVFFTTGSDIPFQENLKNTYITWQH